MPNLPDLLNASQFEGLAINKTPDGTYAVSILSEDGWSVWTVRATAVEALVAALLPPCPVPLPA